MLVMSWLGLLLMVLVSWLVGSWSFAWGVLAGGIISILSFWGSQKDVTAFIESLTPAAADPAGKDTVSKRKKGFILKFWLRIFVIGIVLLMLIKYGDINVFGLILGLTTVVFTITISALFVVWKYYFSGR